MMKTMGDWQNLSVGVSESVTLGEAKSNEGVTLAQHCAENTVGYLTKTYHFRYLELWPSEWDRTWELDPQSIPLETRTI
jgi:hypothetical protein